MALSITEFLETDSTRLAYRRTSGDPGKVGFVWMGGFHSDMTGQKAAALHEAAEKAGRSFVRFDYFGHGESSGEFAEGDVTQWRADALTAIDRLTEGGVILVGSSMGGWIALLAALARPERVKGLLLIAPAPDFTERLLWRQLDETERREIEETGQSMRASPYGDGDYPITQHLMEDGLDWLLLDDDISINVPVRILQGGRDEDVPWAHSFELVQRLRSQDVTYTLIKDGDHRLSRPVDIDRMIISALALSDQIDRASA